MRSRQLQVWLWVVAIVVIGAAFFRFRGIPADRGWQDPKLVTGDLRHPSDVIRYKGKYVATELYDNRLAISDTASFDKPTFFDPKTIGKTFHAPHYLAISPDGKLLITNGWGSSVVEIDGLDGSGWREFHGVGKQFWAPHGICVDHTHGWIYVGDSLNSRLVRFRDMNGTDWQVFKDHDKQISYIRQLYCARDGVWVSNSFEHRKGLNPGVGATILRITDFASGRAKVVYHVRDANITALAPLADGRVLVGLWAAYRELAILDPLTKQLQGLGRSPLGIPYGIFADHADGGYLVAFLGSLNDNGGGNLGGIEVYR